MASVRRILVADDSQMITTLLTTALETSGYEVQSASNGVETYEMGKSGDFDLVILDQLMPGLLGNEVVEKWQDEGLEQAVILLSGVDDDETVVKNLHLGSVDFVRKPFRMPELVARIRQRLGS